MIFRAMFLLIGCLTNSVSHVTQLGSNFGVIFSDVLVLAWVCHDTRYFHRIILFACFMVVFLNWGPMAHQGGHGPKRLRTAVSW